MEPSKPNSFAQALAAQKAAGEHPDADVLTAFAEGSLLARERETVMAHLAACAECREVVSLSATEQARELELIAAASPVAARPHAELGRADLAQRVDDQLVRGEHHVVGAVLPSRGHCGDQRPAGRPRVAHLRGLGLDLAAAVGQHRLRNGIGCAVDLDRGRSVQQLDVLWRNRAFGVVVRLARWLWHHAHRLGHANVVHPLGQKQRDAVVLSAHRHARERLDGV